MNPNLLIRASVDFTVHRSAEAAYTRMLPEIAAVPPGECKKINLDVPTVVTAIFGLLPGIRALRDTAALLIDFDITHIDRLEDCALALSHAHARHQTISNVSAELLAVNLEATQTRDRLHGVASGMSSWNVVAPAALGSYTGLTGYKRVAADVLLLVAVLRTDWEGIAGRWPCTPDDLDRAEKLATHMLRLAGIREKASTTLAEAAASRSRAYALLFRYYDSARRAVTFLRWRQGDADRIAPSLYASRKPRRSKRDPRKETPARPPASAPAAPEPPMTPNEPVQPEGGPFMQGES